MSQHAKTRELIIKHYQKYPDLQIQDIFKFIFQSSFGCEHLVSSLDAATNFIREESQSLSPNTKGYIEALDGDYSRVHLASFDNGTSAETLGKLFYASAKKEENGMAELEKKLSVVKELISQEVLPFSSDEFNTAVAKWKENGYPAVHHSNIFSKAYTPAYRVIANKYASFLPLFAKIDALLKNGTAVIAIEGGSASGKTTLGNMLEEIYDCNLFHMDDFFLRPEQRTPERYAEVGGNIDRERFLQEILIPLSKNEPINYVRFDCSTFTLEPPIKITPKKLTIIEGAYSMHPDLADYYDFSVFLDISPETQKNRILKRNSPRMAERFFKEWIPLEKIYFSKMQVKERCDLSFLQTRGV